MKTFRHITTLVLAILIMASCQRAFMEKELEPNPVNTFDYLWNKVNQQYAFFDLKGVNWEEVYQTYRPLVSNDIDDDSLFCIMGAMLNTLQDGHTNLIAPFDVSRNDSVYYRMVAEKNINSDVVALNYLTIGHHTTGSLAHNAIRNGQIGYIRYSSFMNPVSAYDLRYILNRYQHCNGLILDMRQNGGGSIANIWTLLSLFDNHGQELYATQIKSGPGHDDFTQLKTVHAADTGLFGHDYYRKPVAVLIDRGSYSATSFFAVCTQAYDNIALIGDFTGGGLGLPNGGELPNGWHYRFSITRTIANDGGNYENGVSPDYRILLSPEATAAGVDNVIEFACDWIQGH